MNESTNTLNWFEIPVTDFARAKKFYETILNITMSEMDMEGFKMGMFPSVPGNGKLSGAICHGQGYKPSTKGTLVYLNADPDLQQVLDRIETAGGKITRPKSPIGEWGFMAMFTDSEGNSIALHSNG